MLAMKVLNTEIGTPREEQASLCLPVNEVHWQRCQYQGRNKKDDRGVADEA